MIFLLSRIKFVFYYYNIILKIKSLEFSFWNLEMGAHHILSIDRIYLQSWRKFLFRDA